MYLNLLHKIKNVYKHSKVTVYLRFSCVAWAPFGNAIAKLVKVPSVEWHQVFTTPWADSAEHEQKYVFLFSLLKDLRLDFNSACLLTIVALFSTERINDTQFLLSEESIKKIRYVFQNTIQEY